MHRSTTFPYLLTGLVFVLVFGLGIFSDGMFADGIFYANVAKNYAQGVGDFWLMYWGNTAESVFHDQPPLAIFLQAQFFKLFGDTIFAERIYSFVFALLHLFLLKLAWKEVTNETNNYYWLPMLLYIVIPLCGFTFRHNLIEVTMGAFDLASVLFFLKGCKRNNLFHFLLGSMFVFLASLSKGMQGLFPLITPFAYWIVWRNNSFITMCFQSTIAVSIPLLLYSIFYFIPEINYSYVKYFEKRIVGTFNHLEDTKDSHLYLFIKLWFELLAAIGVVLIAWLLARKKTQTYSVDYKMVIFLLIIGFSGSLPLMVTLEQRAFYLTTSLPYFVLAISLFAVPFFHALFNNTSNTNFGTINYLLICMLFVSTLFVVWKAGEPKRDRDLLSDLYTIRQHVPKRTAISASPVLSKNWAYKNYFMRYCYINFDSIHQQKYLLIDGINAQTTDTCYQDLKLPLKKFTLFYCDQYSDTTTNKLD